jgi:hypothetical protein
MCHFGNQKRDPELILKDFRDNENFVPLSRNLKLINYLNAQVILIGAREGKAILAQELGITIGNENENEKSADLFTRLRVQKDQVPTKPLMQGKLE